MQGQTSVEFISIFGFILIIVLFLATFGYDLLSETYRQNDIRTARATAKKITEAADFVYSKGQGSSILIKVEIPPATDLNPNKTYIGKPKNASSSFQSKIVNINIYQTDITESSKASLIGSFPSYPGTYYFNVSSQGDLVAIGPSLINLNTSSIYAKVKSGFPKRFFIYLTSYYGEPVLINATSNFTITFQAFSFNTTSVIAYNSPAQIIFAIGETYPAYLGFYSGEIILTASALSSPNIKQVYKIPIFVEVIE
jgi:hypothetical protein